MKTPGQRAYEAFIRGLAMIRTNTAPAWDELDTVRQSAWHVAASTEPQVRDFDPAQAPRGYIAVACHAESACCSWCCFKQGRDCESITRPCKPHQRADGHRSYFQPQPMVAQ